MTRSWRLRKLAAVAGASVLVVATASCAPGSGKESGEGAGEAAAECSDVELRLSHQWPEATSEEGDFRSQIAQRFAEQIAEQTDDKVKVTIYPNSTLAKATEQYEALSAGSIDMSVFPLDYGSGQVPEWSITLMPGLVRSHEAAKQWDSSEIGEAVHKSMEENGLIALTDVWNAGGIGIKADKPVVRPGDVPPGSTWRAAGTYVERMLEESGAGITSLPSSEIYPSMQTGVLDAAVTSASSFASYNLQEQVKSYTSPTENTFWFMYEPLVISEQAFGKMCAEQQEAARSIGADLQEYAYTASAEDDSRVEKIFKDAGVNVVTMSDEDFAEWQPVAEKQWESYANEIEGGQELLDLAKKVADAG